MIGLTRLHMVLAVLLVVPASAQSPDPLAPLPPPVTIHRAVPTPVPAATGFDAYKPRLAYLARSAKVREATIAAVIPSLDLDPRVIRLDRGQPGAIDRPGYFPPFEPYRRRHVTSELIVKGQSHYRTLWPHLSRVEQKTGVPASVMLAIWGKETAYGSIFGKFDVLSALASLAYEGRRRPLFESEFVAAMQLLDQGVPRWRLKGSYAGAMGHPQFMPTNVLKLRVDGDGDGDADIWSSRIDGLASIGNYLRNAGWKAGMLWGVPVRVPSGFNRDAVRNPTIPAECPRVFARHSREMPMRQWRAMGVAPIGHSLRDDDLAALFEPDGAGETAYLITANYRAILDYNCSNFYALSVALLADRIIGR